MVKSIQVDHLGTKPNWLLKRNDEQKFDSLDEIKWENSFGMADNLEIVQ